MRAIPSSGKSIPVSGLGTWITFNVGADPVLLDESVAVMAAIFEAGGTVIDSSAGRWCGAHRSHRRNSLLVSPLERAGFEP
jgi:aryl-alcohol dehydrogenase-like predicted oxidoreductase